MDKAFPQSVAEYPMVDYYPKDQQYPPLFKPFLLNLNDLANHNYWDFSYSINWVIGVAHLRLICGHGQKIEMLIQATVIEQTSDWGWLARSVFKDVWKQCFTLHGPTYKPGYMGIAPEKTEVSCQGPIGGMLPVNDWEMTLVSPGITKAGVSVAAMPVLSTPVSELSKIVPNLSGYAVAHPRGDGYSCDNYNAGTSICTLIIHLNDIHKWSRERIADWLDSLDVDLTVKPIAKEIE